MLFLVVTAFLKPESNLQAETSKSGSCGCAE